MRGCWITDVIHTGRQSCWCLTFRRLYARLKVSCTDDAMPTRLAPTTCYHFSGLHRSVSCTILAAFSFRRQGMIHYGFLFLFGLSEAARNLGYTGVYRRRCKHCLLRSRHELPVYCSWTLPSVGFSPWLAVLDWRLSSSFYLSKVGIPEFKNFSFWIIRIFPNMRAMRVSLVDCRFWGSWGAWVGVASRVRLLVSSARLGAKHLLPVGLRAGKNKNNITAITISCSV